MKTDRELLVLAAKAAGYQIELGIVDQGKTIAPDSQAYMRDADGIRWRWNPLTDDGDALRLAVKLKMELLHNSPNESPLWVSAVVKNTTIHAAENFYFEHTRMAAARLSIVHAAAEIGAQEGTP